MVQLKPRSFVQDAEADQFPNGEPYALRKVGRGLRHPSHLSDHTVSHRRLSFDEHLALVAFENTEDGLNEGGLPPAIGTNNPDKLTGIHGHVDVLDDRNTAPVDGDVVHQKQRLFG